MLKGCQRKIYHIKNPDSTIFDEVYFVLKKRVSTEYIPGLRHINDTEMADEADRIIAEITRGCPHKSSSPFSAMGKAGAFALGAAASSVLIGSAALLLVLL